MRAQALKWLGLGIGFVLLGLAPRYLGEYSSQMLLRALLALVLAESWNLLAGYAGLVSLGTSFSVGGGGYVLVVLLNHTALAPVAAILCAAAGGALLAVVAAPGLLRLRGLYFTVGTLALAEALRLLMINSERFGGATGLFLDRDPPALPALIWMALGLLALTVLALQGCAGSAVSLLLRAVRDDEDVAAQIGVRAFRVKLAVFALVSALMAAAGGIQALKLGAIEPYGMFGLRWSIDTLAMVVIGGLGTRLGPLIGVVLVMLSGELLADYPEVHLALTGLLMILAMRFAPRGIAGLVAALAARWRARSAAR